MWDKVLEYVAPALIGAVSTNQASSASQAALREKSDFDWWQTKQAWKREDLIRGELWGREDSAHQREVADLKAAGLNPILSAGGGGSSSSVGPSAASPIPSTADDNPDLAHMRSLGMLNLVLSAAKTFADVEKTKVDTARTSHDLKIDQQGGTRSTDPSWLRLLGRFTGSAKTRFSLDAMKDRYKKEGLFSNELQSKFKKFIPGGKK